MEIYSPITGRDVEIRGAADISPTYRCVGYDHSAESIGIVYMSEHLHLGWTQANEPPDGSDGGRGNILCTFAESMRVAALLRSYAWRERFRLNSKMVACLDHEYELLQDSIAGGHFARDTKARTFTSLLNEVRSLSFVDRAMQTLANIHEFKERVQGEFTCSHMSIEADKPLFALRDECVFEPGITFATPNRECYFLYEYLYDEGLLSWHKRLMLRVSAKGMLALDRMQKGQTVKARQVFVIRRWDTVLDGFLRPIFDEVGRRLGLTIEAVWERDHNEKLDEKIFRDIRESAACVLHVANDRFNVGLEAGYAIALGKPIVVIREKPADDAPPYVKNLPFDIATLNCFDYDPADPETLIRKLEARLSIAVPTLNA